MKKLFLFFLREKRGAILFFCLCLGISMMVFSLYGEQWEAWLYGAGLCAVLGFITLVVQWILYYRRARERENRLADLGETWEAFPEPDTLAEEEYQEMAAILNRRCQELTTAFETRQQESLDYYTTWAHQIKTPISVMRMMLKEADTEEHRALSAELFRIEQYVDMVLGYIRLGSESSDFVFQQYPLDDLIRQSVRKFALQFIHKKLWLHYEKTEQTVLTDEKWLCFLLEQLLGNAVKYTYEGGVTISVSPGKVLTVRDTGIGIAPEDLPRIFEKGFTGYNGRSDKKATGLGLYLCKQAADKLGIRISVQSKPGVGTEFMLDLASRELEVE